MTIVSKGHIIVLLFDLFACATVSFDVILKNLSITIRGLVNLLLIRSYIFGVITFPLFAFLSILLGSFNIYTLIFLNKQFHFITMNV